MAAYSVVISLLQTLNQRNPELFYSRTAEALDSVRSTAEYFQNVLENASKSRFDTEKIKSLEEKIRVAVSYAEDVVEMKISQIVRGSSWTFGILQHQDLLPLFEKMDTTKKQVMEIVSHHADQVLELYGDSLIGTYSTRYPMLEDDIVQGLDDDLEIIINRLKGRPRDLDVVTISGMGGIGKTTLAKKAYDQVTIRYHFDILAWVTISQEFRARNVLLEALHCIPKKSVSVNAKDYNKMDDNQLAELVQKSLKGQRYLFVVDDIWSTDVWDSLRRIFPDCNNRSRVLLTTRETEVAMYANTCSPHKMRLLSLENGWRLLCDKVFGPKRDHPPELEEIGKVIVEKCQGLPLTISVIAGHLSKIARTLECWKDVARNLSEIIASHPDKCLGVLGLSYHHLPNRLKPCFLSMGDFPEDFQVETWRLIQIWIAEGFIIRTFENGKTLEEVAIDYLEDLISRNLIQARKRRFNCEIKTCGIHDLLREFCLIEAEMTKHMHVERTRPTLPTQRHNARHFSFQPRFYPFADFSEILPTVARSIFLFSHLDQPLEPYIKLLMILPIYRHNHITHDFFSRFNLLRVLAIFNTDVWFESFPLVITTLFHLRYLQFPFHVKIPGSISKLNNLQTLICSGHTLPREIWMMKNLRYICLEVPSHLPSPRIGSLVTGMSNLEELSGVCYFSCTKEVFSGIPNLKVLIIHLPHISKGIPHHQLDLSGLTKLEVFKLYGAPYLRDPIKRFGFPTSLRRLSLSQCCYFDWADLSSTAMMLPNLEVLKLIHYEPLSNECRLSDEWRMSDKDVFKSLKLLLLSGTNLKHWEASSDNFPILKRLVLKKCRHLQEIPADFGEICTLESVELHDCSATAEDSAKNIEREQEDMGNNILKVYIIHNNDWDCCLV
ncbi:putative late blight resistance protein homolog R1B-23 [Solanum tuberosum]|uniref:putative late blight resistance protein homolog R1B-23 n=1 Tax=Solanum tuberosum TaxID=4113 RepID=UPI0003D244A8|nr:PREDICTED: putative late blight resistance protein homolog R1B-23 [Solanum tuberosum]